MKPLILVCSTKVYNGRMLELPHTDFVICLYSHTAPTTTFSANVYPTFTCALINTSVSPSMPGNFSVSCVCRHEAYIADDKKIRGSTSYHKEILTLIFRIVPSRCYFIQTNGFSTSVRLLFPSPHSKISGRIS
jgi:hypothetical protein